MTFYQPCGLCGGQITNRNGCIPCVTKRVREYVQPGVEYTVTNEICPAIRANVPAVTKALIAIGAKRVRRGVWVLQP